MILSKRFLYATNQIVSNIARKSTNSSTLPHSSNKPESIRFQILDLCCKNVSKYGFTSQSIVEAVRELNQNSVLHTVIERGPVEIVEHVMSLKQQFIITRLTDLKKELTNSKEQSNYDTSVSHSKLLREALNANVMYLQAYKSNWAHAISLLMNVNQLPKTYELLYNYVDEFSQVSGVETTRYDWYTERALIASLFALTELYMIQDTSVDSRDTIDFIDRELHLYSAVKEGMAQTGVLHSALSRHAQDTLSILLRSKPYV